MATYLKSIDALADREAPIHRINLGGKSVYKSALGGFCTLTLGVVFLLVLAREAGDVINVKYPFVQIRKVKSFYPEKVTLSEIPLLYFTLHDAAIPYKIDRSKIDIHVNL